VTILVQKFGGSSLVSIDRNESAARIVANAFSNFKQDIKASTSTVA